ncbi:tripartite motif-containing protein 2-like [Saccostrea echinata]|uniref:tripartite motif-containing protein 2-like n=1 Tax=Saccostrea echinata TaxID=191078 RepID=UPI002A82D83F|nr:tripartite motif-containing protein 2-like [Saccostrea echinata]
MALSAMNMPGTAQHFLECGIEDCERNCQHYCNPCHLELCEQCRNEHLKSPENKDHEVVLYQQRKWQLPIEKCKIHRNKEVDLLCKECQVPLCSKCTTLRHHQGHTFLDLEAIYSEKFSLCQEEINKIQEYFLPTSQDLKKEIQEDATEIKKIMNILRAFMKADADSLKSLVDEVVSENMKQLDQIENSLLRDLKTQDKAFSDYITYLQDLVKEFHGHLSSTKPQKLISITSERLKIQPIPETTKPVTPEFTAGQYSKEDVTKLLGRINVPIVKREGRKIKEINSSTIMKDSTKQTKQNAQKSNVKQTLSLSSSVTKVREFKVPGVNIVCHISLDQPGRLWVSNLLSNLVQTDLQGNQLQKIETSGGNGYHTVTQDGDLIFTVGNKKVINRITQDSNITEFIKTEDWNPLSIHSSHINGDLLVGMVKDREGKVTRYNKTGKELQNIHRDNKGQGLYSYPFYITENINGDICTSEYEKAVVVVNKSGQHRFSYKGQGSVFRPYGICTDVLGHILVCDLYNVHLLDQDGEFLSLLLTPHQVSSPVSVCVDDENNLYVGQSGNNTVKVSSLTFCP